MIVLPASFFCLTVHIGTPIYTRMHAKSSSDTEAPTRWQQDVARLWPVAKGSLSEVRKPCTRSNCQACRDGRRHRVFLFCYREDGRSRCAYVPASEVARVRQAIANGRELERRIVAAGRELIAGRQRQEGHART